MKVSEILNQALKLIKSNSPEILTALGVSGVISTAYLAAKAGIRSVEAIEREKDQYRLTGETSFGKVPEEWDSILSLKQNVKLVWKCYIPAGVSGAATIACILGASKTNSRRTAAAVTAYSITERAFNEYREKVVDQIGKGKEQKIRDDIAQDKVLQLPPCERDVIIVGRGDVLCCELYTRRYFKSNMEELRRAQNDINVKVVNEMYVTLDEFYDLINLPYTSVSSKMGWNSNKLLALEFSTTLSENGEPCLAFEYNYLAPLK